MMAFDIKKEYKEFYLAKNKPQIVTVPPMNYIAVREQVTQTKNAALTRLLLLCCMQFPTPIK